MHEMMNTKRLLASCLRALGRTTATAGVLVLLICVFNWVWVLNHAPEPEQTIWDYYRYCVLMSSVLMGAQVAVLLGANTALVLLQRHVGFVRSVVAGIVVFSLDCLAPALHVLPGSRAGLAVYILVIPVLAAAIHLIPERRKREASNLLVQPTS